MDVKQMIATVQIYIHHRKNKEVDIQIRTQRDLMLLTRAYSIANTWLMNNGFKQF